MRRAAALIVLLSAATAFAQAPAPAPSQKAASSAAHDQVVCIHVLESGSLTHRRRICRTRAQWDEQRMAGRERVELIQQQRGGSSQ